MEEIEVPTEHLHEEINEKAEELVRKSENKWTLFVAISTALMAVLAALASLFAGHHSNEALIMQIKASDQWNYYQAKSIKAEVRKLEPQTAVIKSTDEVNKEEESVKSIAEDDEKKSAAHLERHVTLATAVTFLQVAMAVSAISIITRRRFLWYGAMGVAVIGGYFFIMGLV